jgi:flagellar assembly factor FliW
MHISSTRFGDVEVRDDALLDFPDGLIGLPGSGYALIARSTASPFLWLHSTEHPDVAVPVTSPWLFFPEYEVKVSDADAARIGLESADQASILCVVRATPVPAETTINLVSPLVVHAAARLGRQIINEIGGYLLRQPLFDEVELTQVQPISPGGPVAATA